jgi:murein DD-endopeptidase MepM/ murein hydrolase activator NlpD
MATEDNEMYIIHKDCSYAWYSVLNEILVKEGQEVEAGEPIAIVGGDKYAQGNHVRLSVLFSYFCDTCENGKGAYGSAYLKPKFYLSNGSIDTLTHNNSYAVTYPDEIITREMSRRELKKWRKEHSLPNR